MNRVSSLLTVGVLVLVVSTLAITTADAASKIAITRHFVRSPLFGSLFVLCVLPCLPCLLCVGRQQCGMPILVAGSITPRAVYQSPIRVLPSDTPSHE